MWLCEEKKKKLVDFIDNDLVNGIIAKGTKAYFC